MPPLPARRTCSTWYDGIEKTHVRKDTWNRFQALPPQKKPYSPFLAAVARDYTAKSLSRSASEPLAPKDTWSPEFAERNFKHGSFTKRRGISEAHIDIVHSTRLQDDVEFYGAKGAQGFREYLVGKFGSIIAGWRHMDIDGSGRLTFGEFCTQCRRMGYHGSLQKLWRELDVNLDGSVSLGEIDQEAGRMMGTFKLELLKKYGDLLTAWQKGLDTNESGRIEESEVAACIEDLGLQLNPKKLFNMMRSSPNGKGLTLDEFDADAARRLRTGDLKGHVYSKTNMEFIEDVPGLGEDVPLPESVKDRHEKGGALNFRASLKQKDREELAKRLGKENPAVIGRLGLHTAHGFKRALISRFGSLVSAWKEALDLDGNERLTFGEFCLALHRLGIHGDVQALWNELGGKAKGFLILADVHPDADAALSELRSLAKEQHGSMLKAWVEAFDVKGIGSISEDDFAEACKSLGFSGNPKKLFRWMRPEAGRTTLSLRDFDTKAHACLSRGDFRMLTDADTFKADRKSPLDMSFEERCNANHFHAIRRGLAVARRKDYRRACLEANIPDRLIDTPEEFEQLCIRKYGSIISAWRLCLDQDQSGKLTFNEFCEACRRLGYAGNLTALFEHYDVDNSGHLSLQELDKESHEMVTSFLGLLNERYQHLDNAWKKGFGKDPHETINLPALRRACEKLGYEHSAKKLFKMLQPLPGRLSLTIWDIDPMCTRKRQRGHLADFSTKPKDALYHHVPSHGELTAPDSKEDDPDDGGTTGTSHPSSPSKKRSRASNEPESPFSSKWAQDVPEIVPGVSGCSSIRGSMLRAMVNRYGTTVACWRLALDAHMTGTTRYTEFCRAMQECGFSSRIREAWRELAGAQETITFKEVDPATQRALDRTREKLVGRYGSLVAAWKALRTMELSEKTDAKNADMGLSDIKSKPRVDAKHFADFCEQPDVGIQHPQRVFKLLLAYAGQRSITLEDLEVLLIGLPPDECHAVWSECAEGKKPSRLPTAMKDARAPDPPPRAHVEKSNKADAGQLFLVNTVEALKRKLELRYGSLFTAWHYAIDTSGSGRVVPREWAEACRRMSVENVASLWKELVPDKSGQLTFKDFDAETAEGFEALEKLLVEQHGDTKKGWRKCFEVPEPKNERVGREKFVKQCGELGVPGDAGRLFKGLQPEPGRQYLLYTDLWFKHDPNNHHEFSTKRLGRAAERGASRTARLRGTMNTTGGPSYDCQGSVRDCPPAHLLGKSRSTNDDDPGESSA